MTHNEVKETLKTLCVLTNSMDQEHLKRIFLILVGIVQDDEKLFDIPDVRKTVKSLLIDYTNSKHLNEQFTPKQIKQIYAIMGDYKYYPVCGICGQPIIIDSKSCKNSTKEKPMGFTWDHIYPKSLGGEDTLKNFQPTHKLCNNHRGNKGLYGAHYTINIVVNINSVNIINVVPKKTKNKKTGLRKQDSWCHKERRRGKGR